MCCDLYPSVCPPQRNRSLSSLSAQSQGSQDDDMGAVDRLADALTGTSVSVSASALGGIFGAYELTLPPPLLAGSSAGMCVYYRVDG